MTEQYLSIKGNPNSGTFNLGLDDQTTNKIAYHPSATQLQTALASLSNVGAGKVKVGKVGSWDYAINFDDTLGDVSRLEPDYTLLKPTGTTSVVVSTPPKSGSVLVDRLAGEEEANAEAHTQLMECQLAAIEHKRMAARAEPAVPYDKLPL